MNDLSEATEVNIVSFSQFLFNMSILYHVYLYNGGHVGALYAPDTQKNAKIAFLSLLNDGFYHAKKIDKNNHLRKVLEKMSKKDVKILNAYRAKYMMRDEWKSSIEFLKLMISRGDFKTDLALLDNNIVVINDIY